MEAEQGRFSVFSPYDLTSCCLASLGRSTSQFMVVKPVAHNPANRPNTYIDATRGRTISRTFIVCHVVPEGRKEKRCQSTSAETPCYTLTLGEVVLPLVASMYVLGQYATNFSCSHSKGGEEHEMQQTMQTVISKDGTPIAFDQPGQRLPLILAVGAFNTRSTGAP